jgi:hypothetical protein
MKARHTSLEIESVENLIRRSSLQMATSKLLAGTGRNLRPVQCLSLLFNEYRPALAIL